MRNNDRSAIIAVLQCYKFYYHYYFNYYFMMDYNHFFVKHMLFLLCYSCYGFLFEQTHVLVITIEKAASPISIINCMCMCQTEVVSLVRKPALYN